MELGPISGSKKSKKSGHCATEKMLELFMFSICSEVIACRQQAYVLDTTWHAPRIELCHWKKYETRMIARVLKQGLSTY